MRRATERAHPAAPLVCFSGRSEIVWLRWLKPGFRHCFCLMPLDEAGSAWLLVDPRCNRLEVRLLGGRDPQTLARHLRRAGYRVQKAPRLPDPKPWPSLVPGPYTCVEVVKRTIGLTAPLTLTPYALFLRLKKISRPGNFLLPLCSFTGIKLPERTRTASEARVERDAETA